MIVEYLRYTIPAERQADFVAAYEAAMEPLIRSEHAQAFELCQCVDEPASFILRIEWTSAEAHMQGFRGSAEFREFFSHIRGFLPEISEMRHYERLLSA